jgi:hypothetical protein
MTVSGYGIVYSTKEKKILKKNIYGIPWTKRESEKMKKILLGDPNKELEKEAYQKEEIRTELLPAMQVAVEIFLHGVDFSKPFRMVIDYNPKWPRAVRHLYYPRTGKKHCSRVEFQRYLNSIGENKERKKV